jgi:hypothetical protein
MRQSSGRIREKNLFRIFWAKEGAEDFQEGLGSELLLKTHPHKLLVYTRAVGLGNPRRARGAFEIDAQCSYSEKHDGVSAEM